MLKYFFLCFSAVSQVFAQSGRLPAFYSANDINRVKEIRSVWNQKGASIWPGVSPSDYAAVLVYSGRGQAFLGFPKPPAPCAQFVPVPEWTASACFSTSTVMMYNIEAKMLAGVPAVYASPLSEYSVPVSSGDDIVSEPLPYHEYIAQFLQADFQIFQNGEKKLFKPLNQTEQAALTRQDYPYLDADINALLSVEGGILLDIVRSSDSSAVRKLLADLQVVRKARLSKLHPYVAGLEKYYEFYDGTAEYVKQKLRSSDMAGLVPLPATLSDSAYASYISTVSFRQRLSFPLEHMTEVTSVQGMAFAQSYGAALCHALDIAFPEWKHNVFREHGSFDTLISAVAVGHADGLGTLKEKYGFKSAREGLASVYAASSETAASDMRAVRSGKVAVYELEFKSGSGRYVVAVTTGTFADSGKERFFQDSPGTMILFSSDFVPVSNIVFHQPAPVIYYKNSGRAEVFLPSDITPKTTILSSSSEEGNEKRVYEGNVRFFNEYWAWSGSRLEIGLHKGRIRMVFFP